eukprot:TRINITY_DN10033_c2_g1_i1.p1 TRINITY_DN10033_c2_g1~~TRINITY_DN10033_c2_g1_i1.p1  ORF type:complete len:276 (+),score=60.39 TRINITY_DN10033_c2_g1_i1:64-891(+)
MAMRPTVMLSAKARRGVATRYLHQVMLKCYQTFWGLGPEIHNPFEASNERWLGRLDKMEGEMQGGKSSMYETDQYTIEHQNRIQNGKPVTTCMTAVEAMERGFKLAPGELPFYMANTRMFYDEDKKQYKAVVRPFWWKNMPGDDGLSQNLPSYYAGEGRHAYLEPTVENMLNGEASTFERFKPATPEEAAEIEAEEEYERQMRASAQRAVAQMNIVEVPPFYIVGQKTWNSTMPWYKAKKAKGTLTEFERAQQNWTLIHSWNDTPGGKALPAKSK